MAGALPSEEYQAKLERAGFSQVNVTVVKPHEVNLDIVKRDVDLTPEEFEAMKGVSASALVTAVKAGRS